ncbi:hypothetical protein ACLOJK_031842 [Asimina triloba]
MHVFLSGSRKESTNPSCGKMAKSFLLLVPLFLFSFRISSSSSESPNPISAHDQLKNKGFPIGLLPAGVLNYTLDPASGDFSVHFPDSCRITLPPDNYLASYSRRVTGKLVEGRIAELDGIRVRAFFTWWSITGIRSRGENLVFEVGSVTAKYPSKNFDETQECEGKRASS